MRTIQSISLFVVGVALSSCVGDSKIGSCAASGDDFHDAHCLEDFTKSECREWDEEPDGLAWSFSPKSCPERGYNFECETGAFVKADVAAWCDVCSCREL